MNADECKQILLAGKEILDPILNPIGYEFEITGVEDSWPPYAAGDYVKSIRRMALIYRAGTGLGSAIYEGIQSGISHDELIEYLGRSNVNRLKFNNFKYASFSKDGGNPFEALAYDIQHYTLGFLNSTDSEFEDVLKQIALSRRAKAKRKQYASRLINAILVSLVSGSFFGFIAGGVFGNQVLGFLVGIVIGSIIIASFLRNEKRTI